MAIRVNSRNLNKKRKIDLKKIDTLAKSVIKDLGCPDAEINIVFISNQKIRALNRRYLRHDNSTDVLAFPGGSLLEDEYISFNGKSPLTGDIAVSSDKAFKNAVLYDFSFFQELSLYVIHGILHIAGYADDTEKKRTVMRAKEHELLKKNGRSFQ